MFCTRKKQKTYIEHESGAHLIPNITKESSFEDIYEVFTACKIFWQLVLLYFNRESNDLICIGNWIISSISSKTAAPSWIKYQSKLHLISVFGTKQKALAISQFLSSQVTYQNRSGVWNVKCCIYLNCLNWLFSKDGIANPCWITIITFENICLHCENQNSYCAVTQLVSKRTFDWERLHKKQELQLQWFSSCLHILNILTLWKLLHKVYYE